MTLLSRIPPPQPVGGRAIHRWAAAAALAAVERCDLERAHGALFGRDDRGLAVIKAATGSTSEEGFGAELVQTAVADLLAGLGPQSAGAALFAMAQPLSFTPYAGRFSLPSLAQDATASWVGELDAIPALVAEIDADAMEPRKLALIAPLSREILRSGRGVERAVAQIFDRALARALDLSLFSEDAETDAHPAGLLRDVAAITGYGGDDALACLHDMRSLASAVQAAAGSQIAFVMTPDRALALAAHMPAFPYPVLPSGHIGAEVVIAVAVPALAVALGKLDIYRAPSATVVMATDAGPISEPGDPPTVGAPVRSFYQTDSIAIRAILDVTWRMRGTGGVAWVQGAGW